MEGSCYRFHFESSDNQCEKDNTHTPTAISVPLKSHGPVTPAFHGGSVAPTSHGVSVSLTSHGGSVTPVSHPVLTSCGGSMAPSSHMVPHSRFVPASHGVPTNTTSSLLNGSSAYIHALNTTGTLQQNMSFSTSSDFATPCPSSPFDFNSDDYQSQVLDE